MTGPIGGPGPRGSVEPTAVVRIGGPAPVGAAAPIEAALQDALERTGLDLSQLLAGGADALVVRPPVNPIALGDVLERARGALVRNAPQELLEVLDREWPGAARAPAGWYYRAAALALLGLPGEAERVLTDGLAMHDASALHFARSVVRLARGDLAGARAAWTAAWTALDAPNAPAGVERAAAERLLRAWETLLLARRGQFGAAESQWQTLVAQDDPAVGLLSWLQQALARVRADATRRDAAVGVAVDDGAPVPPADEDATWLPSGPQRMGTLDAVDVALRRVGARVREARGPETRSALVPEVLTSLQALATGGTLWDAAQPARVHAARGVLAGLLQSLLASSATDAASDVGEIAAEGRDVGSAPLASRRLLAHLCADELREARALLPRVATTEGPLVAHVLASLLDGADGLGDERPSGAPSARSEATTASAAASAEDVRTSEVQDGARARRDDLLATPLRFGLLLVPVELPIARRARVEGPPAGVLLEGRLATTASRPRDEPGATSAAAPQRALSARRMVALVVLVVAAWWWLSR